MAPVLRRQTGASASTEIVDVDLVADIYPAEAAHPSPAAGFDYYDAAEAVAVAPMAVMATHATTHATTLAPAASGSLGRDERRGADSGDGGDSEHCLADHRSLLVDRMRSHIRLFRRANDPSGSTARRFVSLKSTVW